MVESVIFSNTRGFQNKKTDIESFVDRYKPSLFLVAEHFQSTTTHLQLANYELAASYCRPKGTKGGVAIFIRSGLIWTPRTDLDSFNLERIFEVRSVEIKKQNMVVSVVYRSPSKSFPHFLDILEDLLIKFCQQDKKHIIGGDFNAKNNESKKLAIVFAKYNYKLTTNLKTHNSGNCLDNIAVNFNTTSTKVLEDQLSDHNCIKLDLHQEKDKRKSYELMANIKELNKCSSSGKGSSISKGLDIYNIKQNFSRLHPTSVAAGSTLGSRFSEESSVAPDTHEIKNFIPPAEDTCYVELCLMVKELSLRLKDCYEVIENHAKEIETLKSKVKTLECQLKVDKN